MARDHYSDQLRMRSILIELKPQPAEDEVSDNRRIVHLLNEGWLVYIISGKTLLARESGEWVAVRSCASAFARHVGRHVYENGPVQWVGDANQRDE